LHVFQALNEKERLALESKLAVVPQPVISGISAVSQ
jgi:hypothetical protein